MRDLSHSASSCLPFPASSLSLSAAATSKLCRQPRCCASSSTMSTTRLPTTRSTAWPPNTAFRWARTSCWWACMRCTATCSSTIAPASFCRRVLGCPASPRASPATHRSPCCRSLTLFSIRISQRLLSARPFSPLPPSFLLRSRQTVLLNQVPELPAAAAAAAAAAASTPPSP